MAPRILTSILFRPLRLLLIAIIFVYVSTKLVMRLNSQNPNSQFFDPTEDTYAHKHTAVRKESGKRFVAEKNNALLQGNSVRVSSYQPDLAVVFVSVKRKNEQYMDAALGSFLQDLTQEQRRRMSITVNLGDFNPSEHPFFDSAWLHGLVDQIGVRMATAAPKVQIPSTSNAQLAQVKVTSVPLIDAEKDPLRVSSWHRKATLDYAWALSTCHQIGAPNCLIAEDDVVFTSNWYKQVEPLLFKADQVASPHHWGYIRLFWAEKYFGWESDEVPMLVSGCVASIIITAILLFGFCRLPPRHILDKEKDRDYHQLSGRLRSEVGRVRLPLASILVLIFFVLFHAILLILAGRNHFYPVPKGLSLMPSRGCCTQAIIYPLDVVQPLASHLVQNSGAKPYDIMTNRWMEAQQREKLAINPPVLQHIGEGSSRQMAEEYWRRTPLWSFAFEKWQPIEI